MEKDRAILNATLELIVERGFHGTPMSMIARRSGVSAGIIYHYFDNKDALIRALYKDVKGRYSAALAAGAPQTLPWPQNVMQLWLNAFRFYANHPQETIFLEQYENSPYQEDHALYMETDDNFRALGAMVERDITNGHIRAMPFEVLYELTVGVALGLAKRQINGVVQLDDATLEDVALMCCRAISTATPPL